MTITKKELDEILATLDVPLSEETPKDDEMNEEIRVHYWEYIWEDEVASGNDYTTVITYQISVVADRPRHPKLLELKKLLNEKGLHPTWQHEYLTEKRYIHSFCAIDVLEDLKDECSVF